MRVKTNIEYNTKITKRFNACYRLLNHVLMWLFKINLQKICK